LLRHPDYTRTRIRQLAERMKKLIYPHCRPVEQLLVAGPVDRITCDEAQKLKYRPAKLGEQFGPLWATYWFQARARVPDEWAGQRVDLLWISHSEATLWVDGRSLQGLNHEPTSFDKATRPDAILLDKARAGQQVAFQIEMACNRVFGAPGRRMYDRVSDFVLDRCDIALFDQEAWDLYYDYFVLAELEAALAKEDGTTDRPFAGELLYELNRVANEYDAADRATWGKCRRILKQLYARHNATTTHELSAIGHAHIDTAWLWPLAETHRKCTRTFSSQIAYMRDYPEYRFACSQAYQYAVIKRQNPDLYRRIRDAVKRGQWVPVGGTWIEPDCNLPSGESLARQFLHGQRFFQREFGIRCREFWNPDVFGYNGQLPQIMRLAGITRFLTQKLSWNRFNKPHHHTFTWQGIDGSEVLAHFPPADTYNAMADVAELRKHQREYKDHDRSRHGMMLFGYGDGGGGPTKHMLEMLRRVRDLQGLPRTKQRSSDEFFDLLEKDIADRPLIVGELYFEYHRGTYTTQASTKRNNRKNELLLHDVEFLAAAASRLGKHRYPAAELDRLWKLLLLNQFHDILPGSSITLVYEDAEKQHAEIRASGEMLRQSAAADLLGGGKGKDFAPINTIGFDRCEAVGLPGGREAFVLAPSYGVGQIVDAPDKVTLTQTPRGAVLENALLRATVSKDGRLLSLVHKPTRRQTMAAPGNVFELYDDRPTNFDAWDVDPFHLETRKEATPAKLVEAKLSRGKLTATVTFERKLGRASTLVHRITLRAGAQRLEFSCDVDWHEDHTMLKVAFPVNVRAMDATYEMQFGSVQRPTHYNTPYDLARYEVPGHKWADLSEHGFGVALLSESKYGYSTFGNTMRLSLLRSPKSPDPQADRGRHSFAYALFPHGGSWQAAGVVAEAARFNSPLLMVPVAKAPAARCLAAVDDRNLVLDTIKKAEDDDAMVVRLYEAHGARGTARLSLDFPHKSAAFCNILEEEQGPARIRGGAIEIPYGPYQIISLKIR